MIELDLHQKNSYQARVSIDAALRRAAAGECIRVIHGCHGGTALRELVRTEYAAHERVRAVIPVRDGATDLLVKQR